MYFPRFTKNKRNMNILLVMSVFTIIEVLGGLCLALFAASSGNGMGVFATLAMIGAAAYSIGMLTGFLFGIPRTVQEMPEERKEHAMPTGVDTRNYPITSKITRQKTLINTNLEQVSDWLTKIIVGVGLVEFGKIKNFVAQLSTSLAGDMGNIQYARPFLTACILACLVFGFGAGYLLTRLWLSGAFAETSEDVETINKTIQNLVNLDLDLKHLSHQEADLLKTLINWFEKGEAFILPEQFTPRSEQHQALESLEQRYIIRAIEYGGWESGKTVELTPIAQKMLDNIKQEFSTENT